MEIKLDYLINEAYIIKSDINMEKILKIAEQ